MGINQLILSQPPKEPVVSLLLLLLKFPDLMQILPIIFYFFFLKGHCSFALEYTALIQKPLKMHKSRKIYRIYLGGMIYRLFLPLSQVGVLGKAGIVVSSAKPMQASWIPWVTSRYAMNQACSGLRHGLGRSAPTRSAPSSCWHFGNLRMHAHAHAAHTGSLVSPATGWSGSTSNC